MACVLTYFQNYTVPSVRVVLGYCIVILQKQYLSVSEFTCIYYVNEGVALHMLSVFQGPATPLYLGADILSNTDIRIENHPRYHAKFAKKGLATKINFSPGKLC